MRIASGVVASCILAIISAADQHEEMVCKARPGCQLAKCDPGPPSLSLNTNEYPVTCIRTQVQDGEEYNELKTEIRNIRAEVYRLNDKNRKLEESNLDISKGIVKYFARL